MLAHAAQSPCLSCVRYTGKRDWDFGSPYNRGKPCEKMTYMYIPRCFIYIHVLSVRSRTSGKTKAMTNCALPLHVYHILYMYTVNTVSVT